MDLSAAAVGLLACWVTRNDNQGTSVVGDVLGVVLLHARSSAAAPKHPVCSKQAMHGMTSQCDSMLIGRTRVGCTNTKLSASFAVGFARGYLGNTGAVVG
jgi:hypothetical protein